MGWDFLKAKESYSLLTIDLNKQIQGSLSIPFFAWIRIDMVHKFCDIRLGKTIHWCSFGNHISNELMVPFAVTFLITVHRIAVENPALDLPGFRITFDFDGIGKFTSSIREDHLKEQGKVLIAKPASQCPKGCGYGCSCIAIPEVHQLQVTVLEQNRKQNLAAFSADNAVYLADHVIWMQLLPFEL